MKDQNDIVHLREYGHLLKRGWHILLLLAVCGFLSAFIITDMKEAVYEANAELVIERARGADMLSNDRSPFLAIDETFLQTQARVLQSEMMITKAIQRIRHAGAQGTGSAEEDDLADGPQLEPPSTALIEYMDSRQSSHIIKDVLSGLSVGFVPKTRIFVVRTRDSNPEFASVAANAIAAAFGDYVSETYASSTEKAFMRLRGQAEELSQKIRSMANDLIEFRHRSDVALMTREASDRSGQESNRVVQLRERLAMGTPEIAAMEDELTIVKQEIAELAKRYKSGHPKMVALLGKQSRLSEQIDDLKTRAYFQWEREHLMERNTVEFSVRERELEATRKLHELLLTKIKELDFSKSTPDVSARLLKAAEIPRKPAYPNKPVNLLLGSVSGMVLGLLVLFARAQAARNVVSLGTTADELPAPVIARLPHVVDARKLHDLVGGVDLSSPEAEAFKALRTSVEAMGKPGSNVILITSPDRGDGKSTVSAALAHSFAKLGRKVLLIDSDLRRGKLHKVLNTESTPGMVEILRGDQDVAPTEIAENMFFMPRGAPTEQAAELVVSPRMEEFMLKVSEAHYIVLLDCPPILPVTDAALLARYADSKLLVVRSGRTPVDACRVSSDVFQGLGYEFDGLVLNGIRIAESHQYGRYHYYYPQSYHDADHAKG